MNTVTIINIIVYLLIAWFIYTRVAPVKGLKNMDESSFSEELRKNPNKVLIDVREPAEYKSGAIPGAINIPLSQLKRRSIEIPNEKAVFLYCRSGMRSKQAARILSRKGFTNLTNLHGGILAYNGKLKK